MGGMAGSSLAGSQLWRLASNYFKSVAEGRGDEERRKAKRKFIEDLLGDETVGANLRASLELARGLVSSVEQGLRDAGYKTVRVDFVLLERGLVGAGEGLFKTIFEVGMSVDKLLGLPYYPGSGIKGAARSACMDLTGGECGGLFGSTDGVSTLVFTSAYPVGCMYGPCTLYIHDIVNPHYYSGGEPVEKEYEANPSPVIHLSIAPGTVFSTVVAARPDPPKEAVEEAKKVLAHASSDNSTFDAVADQVVKAATALLKSALYTGFAARSSKGYNIGKPVKLGEGSSLLRVSRITFRSSRR